MVLPGIYKHFKSGNLYRVVLMATHTEDGDALVLYHAKDSREKFWARPEKMFFEEVEYPDGTRGPRFVHVPEEEEPLDRFRRMLDEGAKIEFAPNLEINALGPYVKEVLQVLGFVGAFVTDESRVYDFPFGEEDMPQLSKDLGVEVTLDSKIVDLALALRGVKGTHAES